MSNFTTDRDIGRPRGKISPTGETGRGVLSFEVPQPKPVETTIVRCWNAFGHFTAIHRQWRPGDRGNCRLCPLAECESRRLSHDFCTVAVPDKIPSETADQFSLIAAWREEKEL
jgi:hypothetical protein